MGDVLSVMCSVKHHLLSDLGPDLSSCPEAQGF